MKESFEITGKEAVIMGQYGLSPEKLKNCSVRVYSFGEKVISEGRINRHLFIAFGGKAKVGVAAPNGKNLILCFYISEGLMGEAELFSNTPAGVTSVTALESFRCIAVPIECNKGYLDSSLAFARIAAAELAKKLIRSTGSVMEASLYSSEVRVCRYIMTASERGYFRDIMTDVAYSVGISYRHLYRIMGMLCREGILEKTEAGYRICSSDELHRRSQQQG